MNHARTLGAAVAGLVAAATFAVPTAVAGDQQVIKRKVTICHVTSSAKNPYVLIRIARAGLPAHRRHGDFRPTYDKKRRHCIPPAAKHDPKSDHHADGKVTIDDKTGSDASSHGEIEVGSTGVPGHKEHGNSAPRDNKNVPKERPAAHKQA